MRKPTGLKPGAHIRAVTPASPLIEPQLEKATKWLQEEEFQITFADHAFDDDGYLAGSDQERAADLMDAFLNPEYDAVLCTRGGYGCSRLLPYLDLDKIAQSGRMFLGYSDITTLHLALNRRGLLTFYAPMLITLSQDHEPWVYESFLNAMTGNDPLAVSYPRAGTLTPGKAEGQMTGGCLSLLTYSLGTPEALDCTDKIVIIEEVDEHPHRVDAMLTHLLNSGTIQKASGIAIGEMTRTDNREGAKPNLWPWRQIVADRLKPLGIPTIIDFPCGHAENMLTVPMGVRARLDADAGTLICLESPCAE